MLALGIHSAHAARCEKPRPVADGVYLIAAESLVATPKNGGRTGNSVILLGPGGVTLVDPGPNHKAGRALLCSLRRISALPVVALINTHPHPNQVLANAAFDGAAIYASRSTADTMRQRCSQCMARLDQLVGRPAMAGTQALIPDQIVEQETVVHPGGRALRLLPLGDAHSHGDLAVLDEASGSLISGDLGNSVSLPELFDGNTIGWINALQSLLDRTDVLRVIPGFGPPAPQAALKKPLLYLQTLQQFAEEEVAAGSMLPPASVPEVLAPFGGRAETHLLNLQHALREAEAGWWAKTPSPVEATQGHPAKAEPGQDSSARPAQPHAPLH